MQRVGPIARPYTTLLTRQPEPSALVTDQSDCYNIRTIESRLPLRSSNRREGVLLLPLSRQDRLHIELPDRLGLNSILSPSTV